MNDVTVVFELTGYQAEVLRLMAERAGKTVDQLVGSFFCPAVHCTSDDTVSVAE